MTFNINDCKEAIKQCKDINPFMTLMTDWVTKKRFKSKGNWVYEVYSGKMDATLYVTDHPYGSVVTVERPGTQWAFRVADPDDWVSPGDVTFQVYEKDNVDVQGEPIIQLISHINDKFPPHTVEVSPGVYSNGDFTERNLREMLVALDFVDETPPRDEVLVYPSAVLDAEREEAANITDEEAEDAANNKKINDILGKLKTWVKK